MKQQPLAMAAEWTFENFRKPSLREVFLKAMEAIAPWVSDPTVRLAIDLIEADGWIAIKTKAKLRDAVNDPIALLEQNPERVIGYRQDRRVRYAA